MKVDIKSGKPYLANRTGGLSGPAIKPIALNMVYETARTVQIPVFGIGGISTCDDALEFLMAGAKAIQIGTANYIDPTVTIKVIDGIRNWCLKNQVSKLSSIKVLK